MNQPPVEKFAFGENWRRFLESALDPQRIEESQSSLADLLGVESLEGLRWVDIGCGSGLFSLAAFQMGAESLTSFDVDPQSVACCRELKRRQSDPERWEALEGSVLDEAFIAKVAPADVVYSWGVLHHTGEMWKAIANAAGLVKPGGLFAIAIYNRTGGRRSGSAMWLKIKLFYVRSPEWRKRLLERAYMGWHLMKMIAYGVNPTRYIREYRGHRGMDWKTDVIDWLGGYPYEYAGADEIFEFCRKELDMELIRLKTVNHTGNNQFVFRKRSRP